MKKYILIISCFLLIGATTDVTVPQDEYAVLMKVMEINSELLSNWELKHSKGCRYHPRKHKCSCGLIKKSSELKNILEYWAKNHDDSR